MDSLVVSTNPLMTPLLAQIFLARLKNSRRRVLPGIPLAVMGVLLVIIGSAL